MLDPREHFEHHMCFLPAMFPKDAHGPLALGRKVSVGIVSEPRTLLSHHAVGFLSRNINEHAPRAVSPRPVWSHRTRTESGLWGHCNRGMMRGLLTNSSAAGTFEALVVELQATVIQASTKWKHMRKCVEIHCLHR